MCDFSGLNGFTLQFQGIASRCSQGFEVPANHALMEICIPSSGTLQRPPYRGYRGESWRHLSPPTSCTLSTSLILVLTPHSLHWPSDDSWPWKFPSVCVAMKIFPTWPLPGAVPREKRRAREPACPLGLPPASLWENMIEDSWFVVVITTPTPGSSALSGSAQLLTIRDDKNQTDWNKIFNNHQKEK